MIKKQIRGFTASSFDLLHPGHILMLEDCKKYCDYLIVGFNVAPINKICIQSVYERYKQLSAIKYIDQIIPYSSEEDLLKILKSESIDIRFLGEDYVEKDFTGKNLNIKIHYNPRKHDFSTTELKERLKEK